MRPYIYDVWKTGEKKCFVSQGKFIPLRNAEKPLKKQSNSEGYGKKPINRVYGCTRSKRDKLEGGD